MSILREIEKVQKMSPSEKSAYRSERYNSVAVERKRRGDMLPVYLMAIVEEVDKYDNPPLSVFFQGLLSASLAQHSREKVTDHQILSEFCKEHIPCIVQLNLEIMAMVDGKDEA